MKVLARILAFLSLLLLLAACGTPSDLPLPTVEHDTGFVFHVDPERETVTLVETPTLESLLAPTYLPSDTRILQPGKDIALKNVAYRFLSGNRLVLHLKVKNVTDDLTFEPPFFFTLNEDTARIKSATAPLVTDRDLGGDGVLSPGERTRRLTFEVRHKNKSFTFLIDTSAVVTAEPMGKIAFQRNGEIHVMNADGSNQTNLTNNPENDWGPVWNPDGTQIAFGSTRDGYDQIYVMNADGSNLTNLTNSLTSDSFPAWSPDGTQLAFASNRDGNYEIYLMNADGSNPTRLTNSSANDGAPVWSPDGTQIAFASTPHGNIEIYVMNADGSNLTNLTNHPKQDYHPAWSPDGTQIAFSSERDSGSQIYVMNADGSNPTRLINTPSGGGAPAWSPDGTQIAFSSTRDGNWEIYVMNADGSNQTNLTNSLADDGSIAWQPIPR